MEVHLVEVSPALRQLQFRALKCTPAAAAAGAPGTGNGSAARGPDADSASSAPAAANSAAAAARGAQPAGNTGDTAGAAASSSAAGAAATAPPLAGISGLNGARVTWHSTIDTVPDDAFTLYVAHELFDALPVHCFVKHPERGWLETMVDEAGSNDEDEGTGTDKFTMPPPAAAGGFAAELRSTTGSATGLAGGVVRGAANGGNSVGGRHATQPATARLLGPDGMPLRSTAASSAAGPSSAAAPAAASASASSQQDKAAADSNVSGTGDEGGPGLHFRLVLSPSPTPSSALLAPRRLRAMMPAAAEATTELEVGLHCCAAFVLHGGLPTGMLQNVGLVWVESIVWHAG